MKRVIIAMVLAIFPVASVMAERWEFTSNVEQYIPDPEIHQTDTIPVIDSLFIPLHASVEDINIYVGITTNGHADDIDIVIFSPRQEQVYLSHYNHQFPRRWYFDCWFDTEEEEDGPGQLEDYAGQDAYGWWTMICYDISPSAYVCLWRLWRIELYGTQTAITPESDDNLQDFYLAEPQPNPFNESVLIEFGLPVQSSVSIEIFDVLGRRAASVADGTFPAGVHRLRFTAEDLASGTYYINLRTPTARLIKKASLLK